MTASDIARTEALLLRAPFEPQLWTQALSSFARACGGHVGQLVGLDSRREIVLHWVTGMTPGDQAGLEASGLFDPRVNPRLRIGMHAPLLAAMADQDHVDQETRRRHPIYAELFDPMEIPFNCQGVLEREPDFLLRVSVSKAAKQGPLDVADFAAFNRLTPQIQGAVRLQMTLQTARTQAMVEALEAVAAPALLLDELGAVIAMTEAAETLVQAGDIVTVLGRRLSASVGPDQSSLSQAIAAALAIIRGEDVDLPAPVALRSRLGFGGRMLDVRPLAGVGRALAFGAAVIVSIRPAMGAPDAQALCRLFGLTEAEAAVALGVAAGESLASIAARRHVGKATVRSQLVQVFAKLGVSRQSQLVARLNGSG